jgi:FkbM family methyltransferase
MSLKQIALNYLPEPLLKSVRALHYSNSLKKYSLESEPDLLGCRELIKPGDTVLDVGANIGVYTRFCSEFVGPTGQVFSLEPVPETFSYLDNNVRSLKLDNVKCFNFAASDHDSDSDAMTVPEYRDGGSNLYESTLSSTGNVQVKVTTLDTLFPDLSPQFIKCDVEGHEIACIRGAMDMIRRCRPNWMVEVSKNETFELFQSMNYAAFSYEGGAFRPFDSTRPSINYFFFPQ